MNPSQLLKYLDNDPSLDLELNLEVSSREISPELREIVEKIVIPKISNADSESIYSTLWTVIEKGHNKMVGDLCFMAGPDEQGEIQIGYRTYERFRNMGLMTEAVDGLIKWAEMQPKVKSIVATTDKKNIASYSVLIKNRFKRVAKNGTMFQWQLKLHYR
ncbi:MAG TPA: GNAT family N-acetyltransferase [Prolixibacteraceae bacterium]|nr:GNAT family N-acetyltransferase [Prolixibacteraceae bacterium]